MNLLPPSTFRQRRAALGAEVLAGTMTEATAVRKLTATGLRERTFVRSVMAEYATRSMQAWLKRHRELSTVPSEPSLFPELDLPRQLEISPGRFKPVADMTARDWDAAVVQAETKERNASGHAEMVRAARRQVHHLLLVDDELTTAQVLGRAA